ncbi:MAG: helix-turn-helix domain-containing protein [Candidatus Dormibacteraceae bacterium]
MTLPETPGSLAVANGKTMAMAEAPDVVTVDELRKLLRISRNQAYTLVKKKGILACRIGGAIRIPKAAIEDFLAGSSAYEEESGKTS